MDAHGLFIHHLLKGVLAASQSGQLSTKLLHTSVCRLRVDVSFHLLWANAKEHACGIAWYECAQVRTRPPRWLPRRRRVPGSTSSRRVAPSVSAPWLC